VAYQNQIVMEPTLEAAIGRIFQGTARGPVAPTQAPAGARPAAPAAAQAGAPAPVTAASLDALAARAREHYQRAVQAQREGDWARYGEEIRLLGEVLDQMAKRQ
jgi:uncharacterized membrane protein (UPF0182 family)